MVGKRNNYTYCYEMYSKEIDMEKLREYCKKNGLHIIAEEDTDYSILTVDQKAGAFVVVELERAFYFKIKRYTIEGGVKISLAPDGEVRIETLPIEKR